MMSNPQDIFNSILRYAGELNNTPQANKYLLIGCIIPMPDGKEIPATSSKPKAKKKKCPTPSPGTLYSEKEPLLETFTRKKGLTDHHFNLLFNILQKEGWIAEGSPMDDFLSLFDGTPCDCKVIWNPAVGKGVLRDLFKMMVDGSFIAPPDGYGYLRIVESHFIYPDGQYVSGLKSGYSNRKAKAIIDTCRHTLLLNPRAKGFKSIEAEIADEFSDIRYSAYE